MMLVIGFVAMQTRIQTFSDISMSSGHMHRGQLQCLIRVIAKTIWLRRSLNSYMYRHGRSAMALS